MENQFQLDETESQGENNQQVNEGACIAAIADDCEAFQELSRVDALSPIQTVPIGIAVKKGNEALKAM